MVSAEQNSVGYVSFSRISMPMLDVMCFTPGGRSIAVGKHASTVSRGEGDALPVGEEALFSTDVQRATIVVEGECNGSS